MELEPGDLILCTVDRIVGTTVFVKMQGTDKEGSIVFSEVSPGRIRNIRENN
jgi:translation initiation factor 2 alpha subunit (eIF-2alpha)